MILIGQYDSPFVRRVGIALKLYNMPFDHPWSTFSDADKIRPYNPLTCVPTLVLNDGEVLIESHSILDYLDGQVPEELALYPRREPARHKALKVAAVVTGAADKAVSLFYERRMHKDVSETWVKRCVLQVRSGLAVLEADRVKQASPYWFGERISHADIALAAVLRFIGEVHAKEIALPDYPAISAHAAKLEAMPVFQEISQPFIPPAT
jgi:glutathione S-transferase